MHALLSLVSPIARYLLGDLTPDKSQQIEEDALSDHHFRREIEIAEEELIAAYIVGTLLDQERLKFETHFLSSDDRARKLKFARTWIETSGSNYPDFTSPFHRYLLGDMTSSEADELEETFLNAGHHLGQLEAAGDDLLIAYFHNTLPQYQRELFESNYLTFISNGILHKLRFAHIMCEYVKQSSSVATLTAEKVLGDRRGWAMKNL